MDIFAIAEANSERVGQSFESAMQPLPEVEARSVKQFADWVKSHSLISINVKLFVIVELLNGRSFQNIYEWADEQAALSSRPVEDILRERLQGFYDRRRSFDGAFENGTAFRYGAINAGGAGLTNYDPYCLVFTRDFQETRDSIAYLPGDSLIICFDRDGNFREDVVETSVAPHSERHLMVAKERLREIAGTEETTWPALVVSAGRYFEAVFLGEVRLNAIGSVRMMRAEYDRIWDLAFGSFARKLGAAERALIQDLVELRRAVVQARIQLETL